MSLTYIASHTFFGTVRTFGSKLSLFAAIDEAVSNYNWRMTAMAGRQVQLNLTRLCMGSREAWEHFKDTAGEELAIVRIIGKDRQEYLTFNNAMNIGGGARGIVIEAGDTRMSFQYETPEGLRCCLSNYRFKVETGSVEAFFPAIREAMYREYLKLMCTCGQPECTSIGL